MRNNQGKEGNKNEEKKKERRSNDDVAKDWRRGYLGSEFVYQAQTLSCEREDRRLVNVHEEKLKAPVLDLRESPKIQCTC